MPGVRLLHERRHRLPRRAPLRRLPVFEHGGRGLCHELRGQLQEEPVAGERGAGRSMLKQNVNSKCFWFPRTPTTLTLPLIDCRSRCVSDAVHGRHVGGQLCVRLRLGQAGAPQRAPPLLHHVRGRRHGVGPAAVETGNVGTAAIAFLTQLAKWKMDRARYFQFLD